MDENGVNGIKKSIEDIIGSSTRLKKKTKTEIEVKKEQFCHIISKIEEIYNRSILLERDFNLKFLEYDEGFWYIIDSLINYSFPKETVELVTYYIYERIDPVEGTIVPLMDEKGNTIILTNPSDLWDLIQHISKEKNKGKNEA